MVISATISLCYSLHGPFQLVITGLIIAETRQLEAVFLKNGFDVRGNISNDIFMLLTSWAISTSHPGITF